MFGERGYAKTSIEQVARQASLSVGAIYLYFRSKEDLYISLLEETFEQFDAELQTIRQRADLNAADRLHTMWSYLATWASSDVEGTRILRLISQPGVRKQLSDEVASAAAEGLNKIQAHLSGLLRECMDAGIYRRGDASATAALLWSLFVGVLDTADARKNLEIDGAAVTDMAQTAFGMVEGGLRPMATAVAEAA